MPVINVPFYVEDEIAERLACGIYKLHDGGVVRWAVGPKKGQIVKHLKRADLQQSDGVNKVLVKAAEFAKANKKLVIMGATAAIGIAAAGAAYHAINKREPKELEAFQSALREYLEAARNQRLSVEVIEHLEASIEELKSCKDFEKIRLELSAQDLATLVNEISRYTANFAEANSVEAAESLKQAEASGDSLFHLAECLDVQKQVLRRAA